MQDHQIISEDQFYHDQMKNGEQISYMSVIQIVIIILIGSFQVLALKRVFRNKN